jgi:CelD/BcsL family acetyltransferase involved in cellulose biosynthesis
MSLSVSFSPLPALTELEPRWRALEAASDASFFLGWTWMGSWLESTGAKPELLCVSEDGRDTALALVGSALERRKFGAVPTLYLNQAGEVEADRPFIEYNGLLVHSEAAEAAGRAAMDALLARGDWKALRLSGMGPDNAMVRHGTLRRRILRDLSPAYFIDLDAVRGADGDYLSLLSSNSRSQIKRSFKDHGDAVIDVADTADLVEEWLVDMQRLNAGRHTDNAWDNYGFRGFARMITLAGLVNGEVELLRISCGGALTGYLLNFLYRGRAMNYQSAFIDPVSSKSKPGLMCHTAATMRYAGQTELRVYSLLAGKDRYKQSLSTDAEELEWWTLERFSLIQEAEALARKLLRR